MTGAAPGSPPRRADGPEGDLHAPSPSCARALVTLAARADFLRAASARRYGTAGFLVQARERRDGTEALRVGFTCSRKLGNAVARNRAKRRLRAVARAVLSDAGRPGWDYVLVGRPAATVTRGFADLLADLRTALGRVHGQGPDGRVPPGVRADPAQ